MPPQRPRFRLELEVDASQREELEAAWREIVSGERPRLATLAEDTDAIMERARDALAILADAICQNPGTGQGRRLVHFIAGLYNGTDYPFDLTDLRALDARLANACLDYLNYDRLGKAEVHRHVPGGEAVLHRWLTDYGIEPAIHLGVQERARLHAMADRTGDRVDRLLGRAVQDLLAPDEARMFGNLKGTHADSEGDFAVHARRLQEPTEAPLCGAKDGPWVASSFTFERLTCRDCQTIVLGRR